MYASWSRNVQLNAHVQFLLKLKKKAKKQKENKKKTKRKQKENKKKTKRKQKEIIINQ